MINVVWAITVKNGSVTISHNRLNFFVSSPLHQTIAIVIARLLLLPFAVLPRLKSSSFSSLHFSLFPIIFAAGNSETDNVEVMKCLPLCPHKEIYSLVVCYQIQTRYSWAVRASNIIRYECDHQHSANTLLMFLWLLLLLV